MGRPGITREQVFETAGAIAHEGTTPTVMAVRKRLGGGSPKNVTTWLGEWKAQNETTRVEALPRCPSRWRRPCARSKGRPGRAPRISSNPSARP